MNTEAQRDSLLYVKDLAEWLDRSESAVHWLVHSGRAPRSAKLAGRRVFRESDVRAWIEEAFADEEKESV